MEFSFQEVFSVSCVIVWQVLKLFVDEQIIESIQGSGLYVKEEWVNYDIYQFIGFYEKLVDCNVDMYSDVKIFEVVKVDIRFVVMLVIGEDDKVWYVKCVCFIKQKLVNLEEIWMLLVMFFDFIWEVMEKLKYYYVEQIKKLVIDCSEQELVLVMFLEEVIVVLVFDLVKLILEKVFCGFLKDGWVFEYSCNVFNIDDYKFIFVVKCR